MIRGLGVSHGSQEWGWEAVQCAPQLPAVAEVSWEEEVKT